MGNQKFNEKYVQNFVDSPSPKVLFFIWPSSTLFLPFILTLCLSFPFISSLLLIFLSSALFLPPFRWGLLRGLPFYFYISLWKGFHFNFEKMLAIVLHSICHKVSKSLENWNTALDALRRLWLTPSSPLPALELTVDKCSSACFVPEISFYNGTCTMGHLFPGGQPHFSELLSVHQALVQLCQFCLHLQYFQRVWSLSYFRRL